MTHHVKYYKDKVGLDIKRIVRISDGCAKEYKSQYVMHLMSQIRKDFDLDEIIFYNFATANEKGPCDSLGALGKLHIAKMEKRGQVRCADAQEVFLALTSTDPAIGVLQPKARTTQSQ